MKRILVYLSTDSSPSLFDIIVGYDSGVDVVIPYDSVTTKDLESIVHGCIFTRRPRKLGNTAILVGGTDADLADQMVEVIQNMFFDNFRMSITADPNGNSTTAAAAVAKVADVLPVEGKKSVILAGTGPVGERVAVLLAGEGSEVVVTSRDARKAEALCRKIENKYQKVVNPAQVSSGEECLRTVKDADIVIATGKTGTRVMSEEVWLRSGVTVLADTNAYPPSGIEGVNVKDDGREVDGKHLFGAVAIGDLKTKVMRDVLRKMYTGTVYMDLERIYRTAVESLAVKKERYQKGDRVM